MGGHQAVRDGRLGLNRSAVLFVDDRVSPLGRTRILPRFRRKECERARANEFSSFVVRPPCTKHVDAAATEGDSLGKESIVDCSPRPVWLDGMRA